MAKRDTLWTTVGITTHESPDGSISVTKARCGVDMLRRIKLAMNPSHTVSMGVKLVHKRVDFIQLPHPMLRLDALKYALAAPEFQSPADQALIQEQIESREPRAPRVPKAKREVKVKSPKGAISLDSIKSRAKSEATVADVLTAVAQVSE